jgi:RHS repeat-associated protein
VPWLQVPELAGLTDAVLELRGQGIPFRMVRSYTSADATAGRLGTGWTDTSGAALTIAGNGDVTLRGEDGQQLVYTRQTDGSYRAAPGARSVLRAVTGGYELTRRDQVVYAFDASGRLLSKRDRNAKGVSFSYGGDGRLASVTDAAGRAHTFSYNGSGLLSSVQLSDGRSVSYGYTNGYLTSVTDVRGGTTSYRYDASGRLDQITDPNGHLKVRSTYGSDGRVVEQLDALGNRTTFAWDNFTQTATVTDARGKVWKDVYSGGVLQRRIDPLGNATVYTFDSNLNVTGITDGRGNKTTMTYDSRGNMLTRTAPTPLSYQESLTYDSSNNLLTHTDGRNLMTTYSYDAGGNLSSVSRAGTTLAQFTRDPATTLVSAATDARGKTTSFGYDSAGNLTSVTTALGKKTTIEYDSSTRPTGVVEARGNEAGANPADYRTSYTWNAADLRTSITDPLGNATTFAYDAVGNVTSVTDAKTHATSYTYDAANHLLTVTAPGGAVTSYAYDGIGNITRKTDANAHVTNYTYDNTGRLATVADPLARTWTYAYDANSNLTRADLPGGGSITRTYDVLNRLTSIDHSDTTPDVQFAYDANGNRTSMTDGLGSVSYTYDGFDRLLSLTRGTDAFSYAYDASGNVTQRTYPGNLASSYSYDDDGQVASVTRDGATTTFAHDAAGRLTQKTLPAQNGYLETTAYDRAGRTAEVRHSKSGTSLSFFQYDYDALGNPTSVTSQDGTTTYAYDVRDRLTEACFTSGCSSFVRYAYDPVGNRTSEVRPTGTTSYTYDAADQLTQATGPAGTLTYAYDGRGNESQAGSRSFSYDLQDRLKSTTDAGATTTYSYDGDGVRRQAVEAGATTNYLWDVNDVLPQLALERDASGSTVRKYVRGPDLVAMETAGQTFYFHGDAMDSIVNLTSATGQVQWTYSYEPFGSALSETKNDVTAPTNPMRFAGEYFDSTGLYHLRARQFDSTTGRFLGTDPAPVAITDPYVSSYVYANNRPTSLIDPTGMGPVAGHGGGNPVPTCRAFCMLGAAVVATGGPAATVAEVVAAAAATTAGAAAALAGAIPLLMAGDSPQGGDAESNRIPTGARAPGAAYGPLSKWSGLTRGQLHDALEKLKKASGLGAADNVLVDPTTGDVYDQETGESLGNLIDEAKS